MRKKFVFELAQKKYFMFKREKVGGDRVCKVGVRCQKKTRRVILGMFMRRMKSAFTDVPPLPFQNPDKKEKKITSGKVR